MGDPAVRYRGPPLLDCELQSGQAQVFPWFPEDRDLAESFIHPKKMLGITQGMEQWPQSDPSSWKTIWLVLKPASLTRGPHCTELQPFLLLAEGYVFYLCFPHHFCITLIP